MFPKHARSVIMDKDVRNIFDVLTKLYEEGYNQVNMVVGSDRVGEFETITNKYNGTKGRHGFYNFQGGVNVISAGDRDPDAEGVTGMSASKLRQAAASNDLQTFMKGMPRGFDDAKDLFNDVRKGMGLNESHDFRTHIQLQSVSEDREAYVSGNLFSEGDSVVITATEEVGSISFLGANYVIVETTDGKKYRKWISDVEKLLDESVANITFNPVIDRAIDAIVHKKHYSNAVKDYLKSKKDLRKIAQIHDLDYKTLKKSVDKVMNESVELLGEGENLDRVKQEYQDAKDDLDDEYEGKIEDARRRDEIEAEQEEREEEEEAEREQQDEDAVKDVEGDQPERYYKGVDKDDKKSRAKHFKKGSTKPAPGDEDAETKPSKYTKKYDQMYGEEGVKSFAEFVTENKALQNKADESGAPKSILKKVYDRGLAAWKTGHRPGTTAPQWGMARVNSFLTYGKTAKTADKDLFDELPEKIQSKIKNS